MLLLQKHDQPARLPTGGKRGRRRRRRARTGALSSIELMLVLPLVLGLFFAVVEFCLLLSANQRVQAACRVAGRTATLPASDPHEQEQAVRDAAVKMLGKASLIQSHRLHYEPGRDTGDPVVVEIRVPMRAAAPDLLAGLGYTLEGRQLVARMVMRKE